mgnify:CR=1 FL=1
MEGEGVMSGLGDKSAVGDNKSVLETSIPYEKDVEVGNPVV